MVDALREQGWDVPDDRTPTSCGCRSATARSTSPSTPDPISVRPFPEGVRVTIGTPEVNDAFLARAAAFRR